MSSGQAPGVVRGETAPGWLLGVTTTLALVAATGAGAIAAPWLAPPAAPAGALTSSASTAPVAAPPAADAVAPPLAPAAAAPAAPCAPVASLRFAYGAAVPPADGAAELAPVIAFLVARPDATALIDGHADASGDELGNLVLSKRRATRVADVIVAGGVARTRLTVRAFGAYVPAPGEPTSSQRRVRVTAVDPSCSQEARP